MMEIEGKRPHKSTYDSRLYEGYTLGNGMKVLFITDPKASKSSCAVSVNVGSLEDPVSTPGLAHFIEHMVFMGSKSYPVQNEFAQFISLNSGYQNGETNDTYTNYYLQIADMMLAEAVKRLVDALSNPLFQVQSAKREMQAIEQQFLMIRDDQESRMNQLVRKQASSPYSKFSVGNYHTLNHQGVIEEMIAFHKRYYSSNIMSAVIRSKLAIEQIKSIIPILQSIPNKQINHLEYGYFYQVDDLQKLIRLESSSQCSKLQFNWILDYQVQYSIMNLIVHFLQYDGPASLYQFVQQWCSEIQVQWEWMGMGTRITLALEEIEENKMQKIYNKVLDYLEQIQIPQALLQQLMTIQILKFNYQEIQDQQDYLCEKAVLLHHIQLQGILKIKINIKTNNIHSILHSLNNNLIIVAVIQNKIQYPKTDLYYGMKFDHKELWKRKQKNIKSFKFVKNPFLPINTTIHSTQMSTPIKIYPNIYYYSNTKEYPICKGGIKLMVYTNQDLTFGHLLAQYFDQLSSNMNQIEPFDLQLSFDYEDKLTLTIYGYNSMVLKILHLLAQQIKASQNDRQKSQDAFEEAKQNIEDQAEYYHKQELDDLTEKIRWELLSQHGLTPHQMQKKIDKMKINKSISKINQIWKLCRLQWIVVGNFTQTQATNICRFFQQTVGYEPMPIKAYINRVRIMKLPQRIIHYEVRLPASIRSSASQIYLQGGIYSVRLLHILNVINNYISQPFFNHLRTHSKIGYDISTAVINIRGILGISFYLASSKNDAAFISHSINAFLQSHLFTLSNSILQPLLHQLKLSVKHHYLANKNSLREAFDFYCDQIQMRQFAFSENSEQQLEHTLNCITAQNVLEVLNQLKDAHMQILLVAKHHKHAYATHRPKITCFQQIKTQAKYYPDSLSGMEFFTCQENQGSK